MVLYGIIWYCMVSSGILWYCIILALHQDVPSGLLSYNVSSHDYLLHKLFHSRHTLPVLSASYFPPWAYSLYFWGGKLRMHKILFHLASHFMLVPNPGLLSGKFTLSEIQLWPVTGAGGFLKHGVTLSLIKSSSHCHQVITWVGLLTHDALRVTHSSLSLSVGKVTNLSRSQFLVPGDRCGPFKRIMGTWWLVNDTVKHHSASTYSQLWKKRRRENE